MTRAESRDWLAAVNPGGLRTQCGFTLRTVADAAGTTFGTVWKWEQGITTPTGAAGAAYCRIVAGLARHLEVTW